MTMMKDSGVFEHSFGCVCGRNGGARDGGSVCAIAEGRKNEEGDEEGTRVRDCGFEWETSCASRRLAKVHESVCAWESRIACSEVQRLFCLMKKQGYRIQFMRKEMADSTPRTSKRDVKDLIISLCNSSYSSFTSSSNTEWVAIRGPEHSMEK